MVGRQLKPSGDMFMGGWGWGWVWVVDEQIGYLARGEGVYLYSLEKLETEESPRRALQPSREVGWGGKGAVCSLRWYWHEHEDMNQKS